LSFQKFSSFRVFSAFFAINKIEMHRREKGDIAAFTQCEIYGLGIMAIFKAFILKFIGLPCAVNGSSLSSSTCIVMFGHRQQSYDPAPGPDLVPPLGGDLGRQQACARCIIIPSRHLYS
jgi:hypothetical protein